jgi:hypothetical protein
MYRNRSFAARFVARVVFTTVVALLAAVIWLVTWLRQPSQQAQKVDLFFPVKTFVGADAWVLAKGTLTGDWVTYKNNTYSIQCRPDQCVVADVSQIGPKNIGSLNGPEVYPIKRWTDKAEVVAERDNVCTRTTITLDRMKKTVLWVETPICKNAENHPRTATLESPLFLQRLEQQRLERSDAANSAAASR